MSSNTTEVVFVDGIQAVGVHNGVARVMMMRLGSDGKPLPALELLMPIAIMKSVIEGFTKAGK